MKNFELGTLSLVKQLLYAVYSHSNEVCGDIANGIVKWSLSVNFLIEPGFQIVPHLRINTGVVPIDLSVFAGSTDNKSHCLETCFVVFAFHVQ